MTAILERRNARLRLRRAARRGVGDGLEEWLDGDQPTTLGTLNDAFGEKILAAACLALMAPSALPIPTAGATHLLDVIAIVFAAQMVLARSTIWLPERWRQKPLGSKLCKALRLLLRFVRRCERISKPRLRGLMRSRPVEMGLGIVISVFIVGAFLSPPFSGLDTLPSLGVVLVALGLLLEDAVFAIAGTVVGATGLVIALFLGSQAVELLGAVLV